MTMPTWDAAFRMPKRLRQPFRGAQQPPSSSVLSAPRSRLRVPGLPCPDPTATLPGFRGAGCPKRAMFRKLLIANRGEIARRINLVAQRLGISTVAVYSDADASLPFVREASEAVRIGPAAPKSSYLNMAAVLEAAKQTGSEAVH